MKKCIPLILFAALTLNGSAALADFSNLNNDPWLAQYRAKNSLTSSTINNKDGEPIEFFNGFSFGVSAGLGLFHGSLADYDMFAPMDDFDKYYKFGWRIHAIREIKWGVSAKLQFEHGKLGGGRLTGKQATSPIDFETTYSTVSALASFDLLNSLFNKKGSDLDQYKFYFNAEVGVGMTFYRSLSYWRAEDGRVRDYVGYTVTDENPPTQRYTTKEKDTPAVAFNIPVGFTAGYRINYKTDVTFSYTLNNLVTDRLDTFDRDFSANDKYSYFGLGLRYNFNREKENYPKKKPKKKKDETQDDQNKKWSLFGSKKDDVSPKDVNLEEPLTARQANPVDSSQENKDLEEVRRKMFELQLKLFEMQYLLNGGESPSPAKPAKK